MSKRKENRIVNFMLPTQSSERVLTMSPDDIPTLVNENILAMWQEGDDNPYYKLQEIALPLVANGITYDRRFFDSFVSKLEDYPIPGSKRGHSINWGERPVTDFILIGADVSDDVVFLKNYIPPETEAGSNETFIVENKSGMIHFSLVADAELLIREDGDDFEAIALTSLGGERNDAVPVNKGAMKQVTNYAAGEPAGDQQEEPMEPKEMLAKIANLKNSGDLDIGVIADSLGVRILNAADGRALDFVREQFGDDVEGGVRRLRDQVANGLEQHRSATLTNAFGAAKLEDGQENALRTYADEVTAGLSGDELDAKIESVKNSAIAKRLAAQQVDERHGIVDGGGSDDADTGDQIITVED